MRPVSKPSLLLDKDRSVQITLLYYSTRVPVLLSTLFDERPLHTFLLFCSVWSPDRCTHAGRQAGRQAGRHETFSNVIVLE